MLRAKGPLKVKLTANQRKLLDAVAGEFGVDSSTAHQMILRRMERMGIPWVCRFIALQGHD